MLLLDEITVDLDVLGRADLMRFLKDECATRGATIIYATHIFDGLEFWPSHLAYLAQGGQEGRARVVAWGGWVSSTWACAVLHVGTVGLYLDRDRTE